MKGVMETILAKIKPSSQEQRKFKAATTSFLRKLKSQFKKVTIIVGGSSAKGTWLAGNHDMDIFVLFPYQEYSAKSDLLSEIVEKKLRKAFPKTKISRLHGSRDYFQLSFQKYHFEVVPILKINSARKARNITDISPLHTSWVNKKARKAKDDIRLAKQFCIANNLYGAESYIGGFSGYVLEILITYYGSFQKMLQASQKWQLKDVIDIEKHYQKGDYLVQINRSKLQSPLIVIDPVDKSRNAAAALSLEKFRNFKKIAQQFLRKPAASFFNKKVIDFSSLKKEAESKKQNLVFIELLPLKGKEDVIGSRLRQAFLFLEKKMQPFALAKAGWDWYPEDQVSFYFFLKKKELPHFTIREGPPLKMKEEVRNFKNKHRDTFNKNERIYAQVPVKDPRLEDFLASILKSEYFKEKVKGINRIEMT